MLNRRLTLIHRAEKAVEQAMRRIQFGHPLLLHTYRAAHRWLRAAAARARNGNIIASDICLENANTFLRQGLELAGVPL